MLSFSDFIKQRGIGAKPHIADSAENQYLWDVAQRYATLDEESQTRKTARFCLRNSPECWPGGNGTWTGTKVR